MIEMSEIIKMDELTADQIQYLAQKDPKAILDYINELKRERNKAYNNYLYYQGKSSRHEQDYVNSMGKRTKTFTAVKEPPRKDLDKCLDEMERKGWTTDEVIIHKRCSFYTVIFKRKLPVQDESIIPEEGE